MARQDFLGSWKVQQSSGPFLGSGSEIRIEEPEGFIPVDRPDEPSQVVVTFPHQVVTGHYFPATDSIQVLSQGREPPETFISRYATEDRDYRIIYGLTFSSGSVTVWGADPQDPPPSNPQGGAVGFSPFDGTYTVRTGGDLGIPLASKLTISMAGTQLAIEPPGKAALLAQPLTVDRSTDSVHGQVGIPSLFRVWSYAARSEGKPYIYGLSIIFPDKQVVGDSAEFPEQAGACGAEEEPPPVGETEL